MTNLPLFTQWLAEEANAASRIKQSAPVMVVLGNPPYSGHSANTGAWIKNLLDEYKAGCPELKKPAQAKWLSDDYVKFIRFAQWRIEQTGYGILAFISNHGYLDNPTFRCMRQSLMQTFDDIYVLDVHGSSKKKERVPDGSKDENVFDIQQGVAIGIFVKRINGNKKDTATVRHAHLWGLREIYDEDAQGNHELIGGKYHWLAHNELRTTKWKELEADAPFFLFVPQDAELRKEYETAPSIRDVFSPNGDPAPGIVTTQDEFAISWSPSEATSKVDRFLTTKTEDEARSLFRLCSQDQWQYERAKKELNNGGWKDEVTELLYRPFDKRWTILNRNVAVHRRERVMRHMLDGANLALVSARSNKSQSPDHFFCSTLPTETKCGESTTQSYLFPLYLYPDRVNAQLFDTNEPTDSPGGRHPNLAPEFVTDFAARLKMAFVADGKGDRVKTFGPEDVFNYMYAVFHSPTYRGRYAEFLKLDFPRLPLTSDPKLFRALCDHGAQLVALHLLEAAASAITDFPIEGNNTVEAVRYAESSADGEPARVWINDKQYFEGVPPEVWHFQVGGYQVANKWLKDRKGRKLTYDEKEHYRQVVAALAATINLMTEIDTAISEHGGWPLK
jgi:predicted helicase